MGMNGEMRALWGDGAAFQSGDKAEWKPPHRGWKWHQGECGETKTANKCVGSFEISHSTKRQECPHHVWGHITRQAKYTWCSPLSPQQTASWMSPPPLQDQPLSADVKQKKCYWEWVLESWRNVSGCLITIIIIKTCSSVESDVFTDILNTSLPGPVSRHFVLTPFQKNCKLNWKHSCGKAAFPLNNVATTTNTCFLLWRCHSMF